MQILKTLAFCFLFAPFYFGQISFYNTYSDEGYDVGEGIVQLIDSSYLVTGSSSSFEGNSQAFIMKIDSLGNRLWSKDFGGFESDKGRRIFQVENDGIYVAGQTNSFGNFYDAYFFKTDLSGNLLYEKHYGSSAYENIHDGILLSDTSFILVGETHNTSNESENIYVLRINRFGDTLWTKNFGSEQKDVARSIKLLNDSTVIVAGEYYVADSLTQKAMLFKMDIGGNVEWLKTYGDLGKYVLNDISIENNVIRGVGYSQSQQYNNGNVSALTMSFDDNGILTYSFSILHNGDFYIKSITKYNSNPDDYYYAMEIINSIDLPTFNDGPDLRVYKFDNAMYYNNVDIKLANYLDDIANQMIATSDNGAILVGSNQKPEIGGSNVLIAKIGPNDYFPFTNTETTNQSLVFLNEIEAKPIFFISPNPVHDILKIVKPKTINSKTIKLCDQLGNEITYINLNSEIIDVSRLEKGIYYISIGNLTQKFVKI